MGDLRQQDPVRHDLDPGLVAGLAREPHLVADDIPELGPGLLCDPLGERPCGDPSGLGVADAATSGQQADLGQLGRLARPCLAGDDDHLAAQQRRRDVRDSGGDGQVGIDDEVRLHGRPSLRSPH